MLQNSDKSYRASLKPQLVLVRVPRKGALNIEMGRLGHLGDSKNQRWRILTYGWSRKYPKI